MRSQSKTIDEKRKALRTLSLDKLVAAHCKLRTCCSKFAISPSEFAEVFEFDSLSINNDDAFLIWDIGHVRMVDALEIFSGLVVMANITLEDQVKFLFDLYDFNEINSLSLTDIELMAKMTLTSLFKIHGVSAEPELEDFYQHLTQLSDGHSRINFSHLYLFFLQSKPVKELYEAIDKSLSFPAKISDIDKIRTIEDPQSRIPQFLRNDPLPTSQKPLEFTHGGFILNSKHNKNKIKVLSSFASSQMSKDSFQSSIKLSKLNLNWVYGFCCDQSVRSFLVSVAKGEDEKINQSQNKLIYAVSSIVVIFYFKLGKQAHFVEHNSEVCALSISKSGTLCASGQQGRNSSILIWNIGTLRIKSKIDLHSDSDPYLIEFVNSDKFLVALCKRPTPSVRVFNIFSETLIISTYLADFIILLTSIEDLSGMLLRTKDPTMHHGWNISASFLCVAETAVHMFGFSEEQKAYLISSFEVLDESLGTNQKDNKITGAAALFVNRTNPESVIYESKGDYEVECYFSTAEGKVLKFGNLFSKEPMTTTKNKSVIFKCNFPLRSLIYFKEQYLCVVDENQQVFLVDIFSKNAAKEFKLIETECMSPNLKIKNIERGDNRKLFFSTWKGEIFQLKFSEKYKWNSNQLGNVITIKRFPSIFKIERGYTSINITERGRKERCLYISGGGPHVKGLSSSSRELVDHCVFEENITCMDCYVQPIGGIVFAFGSDKGKIRIRFDCQMLPKYFSNEKPISVLKFSPSGSYLVAGTFEPSVWLFTYVNGTYFQDPPKILFNHEIPISVNFCTNLTEFIIGTDTLKYYLIKVSEFREKKKYELQSGDSVRCNLIQTKYVSEKLKHKLPVVICPLLGIVITGESEGIISFYDSISNLKLNSSTFYYGHASQVSGLALSSFKDKLYSLAVNDGSLLEWNLELIPGVQTSGRHEDRKSEFKLMEEPIESIKRQIVANSIVKYSPSIVVDSFGYFRSYSNNYLRKVFGEKFETFNEIEGLNKRYPEYSIELTHIYGFDAYNYRNNVCYLHQSIKAEAGPSYSTIPFSWSESALRGMRDNRFRVKIGNKRVEDEGKIFKQIAQVNQIKNKFRKKIANRQEEQLTNQLNQRTPNKASDFGYPMTPKNDPNESGASPVERAPLPHDSKRMYSQHFGIQCGSKFGVSLSQETDNCLVNCTLQASNCYREIIYFVSRIAVIVDPQTKSGQRFYQGHTSKISSLCLHPHTSIVATGETSHLPKVHIWDSKTCSTLSIIDTYHKLGIMCLKFTHDKNMIISSSVDTCSSVQVSDWQTGRVIAFRNTSAKKIVDLAVDPSDCYSFVTATSLRIDFWQIKGNSIINVHYLDCIQDNIRMIPTTLAYITYWSNGVFQKDLLIATSDAKLNIIRNRKYLKVVSLKIVMPESSSQNKSADSPSKERKPSSKPKASLLITTVKDSGLPKDKKSQANNQHVSKNEHDDINSQNDLELRRQDYQNSKRVNIFKGHTAINDKEQISTSNQKDFSEKSNQLKKRNQSIEINEKSPLREEVCSSPDHQSEFVAEEDKISNKRMAVSKTGENDLDHKIISQDQPTDFRNDGASRTENEGNNDNQSPDEMVMTNGLTETSRRSNSKGDFSEPKTIETVPGTSQFNPAKNSQFHRRNSGDSSRKSPKINTRSSFHQRGEPVASEKYISKRESPNHDEERSKGLAGNDRDLTCGQNFEQQGLADYDKSSRADLSPANPLADENIKDQEQQQNKISSSLPLERHKSTPIFKPPPLINLIKLVVIRNETFVFVATDDNLIQIYDLNFEARACIVVHSLLTKKSPETANSSFEDYLSEQQSDEQRTERNVQKSGLNQLKHPAEQMTSNPKSQPNTKNVQRTHQEREAKRIDSTIESKNFEKNVKFGIQALDVYLEEHSFLLLASISTGAIVEIKVNMYLNIQSDKIEFEQDVGTLVTESHASQNFTRVDNEFDFINHKRVYVSIHFCQKVLATCGDDMWLRFWNLETKNLMLSTYLGYVPTCLKFSPTKHTLVIGLEDGRVLILEPEIRIVDIGGRNELTLSLEKPTQVINSISKTSSKSEEDCFKAVLNVEFSSKGDLLAVAHDNVKIDKKNKETLKDRGTAIVIVYVSRDSILKDQALQSDQDLPFMKYAEVRLASLNYADISKMSYLGMASYFMAFSDDDTYLMLYYQNINEHHIRENHDKEGKYVIWNFKSRSSEINWEILKNVQFRSNNFPNHIFGINSYSIADKLNSQETFMERAKLGEEITNNVIVLSSMANHSDIVLLGSDSGDIFLAKKWMFALKQSESPENLDRSKLCQAKRYRAHSSFVNQIEVTSDGKHMFTTGISDECVFQWNVAKIEAKNDLDHMTDSEIRKIEDDVSHFFDSPIQDNYRERTLVSLNADNQSRLPVDNRNFNGANKDKIMLSGRDTKRNFDDQPFSNEEYQFEKNSEQNNGSYKIPSQDAIRVFLTKSNKQRKYMSPSFESREQFHSLTSEVYPKRKKIMMLQKQLDISIYPLHRMQLRKVIGRKAIRTRFNLAVILEKHLIYSAGTSLVMIELSNHTKGGSVNKKMTAIKNEVAVSIANIPNEVNKSSHFSSRDKTAPFVTADNVQSESVRANYEHHIGSTEKAPQNILFAGQHSEFNYPSDIACFEIGSDGRTICVGTNDIFSSLMFWEITSKTFRGSVTLTNCVSPQLIRFSDDMKSVIVLGWVQNHNSCMYFVDIHKYKILAMLDLKHSPTFKIWDAVFIPRHNDQFISVGLVHASSWRYRAEVLEFKELKLEVPVMLEPSTKLQEMQNNEEENLITCFLIIKFVAQDEFLTTCSKGFIYLWNEKEIKTHVRVYNKSPVSALVIHPDHPNVFLTGGFHELICCYRIVSKKNSTTSELRKVLQFDIFSSSTLYSLNAPLTNDMEINSGSSKFQIQNLLFANSTNLIYGTRNGNLGIFDLNEEFQRIALNNEKDEQIGTGYPQKSKEERVEIKTLQPRFNKIMLSAFDDHTPRIADFSFDSSQIFCLSEEGLFSVYDFASLKNLSRINFAKKTQDMIVVKSSIILVFEIDIAVIRVSRSALKNEHKYELDEKVTALITKSRRINKVKVHLGLGFMAIAFEQQSDNNPIIEIYYIDGPQFVKFHTIETEPIELMDFSSESQDDGPTCLLMYQDHFGKVFILRVSKNKVTIENDENVDWASEGLLISNTCKNLSKYYSADNMIVSLCKINGESLVVSDELGTVS